MRDEKLPRLKWFALACIVPGLAGLIFAASLSTYYLDSLPRLPDPDARRMIPRTINGFTVYQTEEEDQRMKLIEYSSVGILVIGLGVGLVYVQKWGIKRAIEAEDDEFAPEEG